MADTVVYRGYYGSIYHFKVKRYKDPRPDKGLIYSVWLNFDLNNEHLATRPELLKVRITDPDLYVQCHEQTNRMMLSGRKRWKSSPPKGDEYEHYSDDE
jgi:hypothetical protein